ncbi:Gag-Pol polyprotein [Bienertia sinuspersici]
MGNKLGEFMTMDKSDVIGINKSLRIRVKVDVTKPLQKTIGLKTKQGVVEVTIKYEKLPVFCYICGLLGHGEKDCDEAYANQKFSENLRVNTPWKANKGTVENNGDLRPVARKLFVTKKATPEEVTQSVDSRGCSG